MMVRSLNIANEPRMPGLNQLGFDLLDVSRTRQFFTIALPFLAMASYALFAWLHWWPLAVISVMALSFITYGSSSHDLVHGTLRLPRRLNDGVLSLIELLSLRSGTAYRLSHLHHHRRLLACDDIEGAAAHGSLLGAIACGPTMQIQIWIWAWNCHPAMRLRLLVEAVGVLALIVAAIAALPISAAPLIYAGLVMAGSWLFPLITVYIPHQASGVSPLTKTRLFRGWLARIVALDHLYHLEHHLYPAVPHHHWKTLADRLDPHFARAGLRPRTGSLTGATAVTTKAKSSAPAYVASSSRNMAQASIKKPAPKAAKTAQDCSTK